MVILIILILLAILEHLETLENRVAENERPCEVAEVEQPDKDMAKAVLFLVLVFLTLFVLFIAFDVFLAQGKLNNSGLVDLGTFSLIWLYAFFSFLWVRKGEKPIIAPKVISYRTPNRKSVFGSSLPDNIDREELERQLLNHFRR